jgi:polyphosphate kinase
VLAVPVEAPELRAELLDTLERAFADNQSSWDLDSDGEWHRRTVKAGERPRNLQLELAELYTARAGTERAAGEREAAAGEAGQPAAAGSASSAALSSSADW